MTSGFLNSNRRIKLLILIFIIQITSTFSVFASDLLSEYQKILYRINTKSLTLFKSKVYPNIIFIDDLNKEMHLIKKEKDSFIYKKEILDKDISLANTASLYNGDQYITIILKEYDNLKFDGKVRLIAHECFHYYQKILGYKPVTSYNEHLDSKEGRYLLIGELKALEMALNGDNSALEDALSFRRYRQKRFCTNNEASFELHEGIAEYYGLQSSIHSKNRLVNALIKKTHQRLNSSQGFTNSFAYITGPIYCYFLDSKNINWLHNSQITDLTNGLSIQDAAEENISTLIKKYNLSSDIEKENKFFEPYSKYETLIFEKENLLLIPNRNIRITFNPNDRIITLDEDYVLLENVTLKSDWGRATIKSGLIRKKDWTLFYLNTPHTIADQIIKGDNYVIELNEAYQSNKKNNQWIIQK